MSTELRRLCDHCHAPMSPNHPAIILDVQMHGPRLVALRGRELCSQQCVTSAIRSLYLEAVRPVDGAETCEQVGAQQG